MKKILGLEVLMMVMLISVSGLAATDTETVEVWLNVPAFVRLTVPATGTVDGRFDLTFDPANPVNPSDTVEFLAEANVHYTVDYTVTPVTIYSSWVDELTIDINSGNASGFGGTGNVVFDVTATIDVLGHLNLGTIDTKIADVTFTISSI